MTLCLHLCKSSSLLLLLMERGSPIHDMNREPAQILSKQSTTLVLVLTSRGTTQALQRCRIREKDYVRTENVATS